MSPDEQQAEDHHDAEERESDPNPFAERELPPLPV
jgi:hypothetical protein